MKKPIDRALVIHSLCAVGKASLTNIMPIMSISGIEACPVPSVVLSSHTGGFKKISKLTREGYIKEAIESLNINDIDFKLVFIGYLAHISNLNSVIDYLKEKNRGMVILDPILGDNGSLYSGFNKEYVEKMRQLLKYSDVITPNITEAVLLTGRDNVKENYTDEELLDIVNDLKELGAKNIVITSVPSCDGSLKIAIYDEKNTLQIIKHEKLKKSYPGTGDIFTSVLSCEILKGRDIKEATLKASKFIFECIEYSMQFDYDTKEGVLLEKQLYRLL